MGIPAKQYENSVIGAVLGRVRILFVSGVVIGVPSRKGFFRTLRLQLGRFHHAQRPESAFGDAFVGVPHVVARQVDVVPAQWSDVRDQAFVDRALLP